MAHVIGYIYTICHALTTKCRIVCTQIYPTILSIDSDLILATVYVPPEQSPYYNEDILSLMENDITDYIVVNIRILVYCLMALLMNNRTACFFAV